jgi:hypothetical protein
MGRTDGRSGPHIQEARPSAAARPSVQPQAARTDPPPVAEGRQTGWRFAALIWAIVFLFLGALAVFDLFAGLFRR